MKKYSVKEVFYSLQGEGMRAGEASVFFRFAGCNVGCTVAVQGFDCDTDWKNGESLTLEECVSAIVEASQTACKAAPCKWVVFTGGEPSLQLDHQLIGALKQLGFNLAVESNGTGKLPAGLDWVCISPKLSDEETLQRTANEVKFVLAAGAPLPETGIRADHYLISPAWEPASLLASNPGPMCRPNLEHCVQLVLENPAWRLSVQQHKGWGVR